MLRNSTFSFIVFILLFAFCQFLYAAEYKVGLRAHSGIEKGYSQWQPTIDYLNEKIPEHRFILMPFVSLAELNKSAGSGGLDFVLTNPSSYVEMEVSYHASRMVTLRNERQGKAYTQFGSVIFTRSGRDDINGLKDLDGKRFMAVSENAFGGWRVTLGELLKNGIDPVNDFQELLFGQGIQENVVAAVKEGVVDAGTVRTDMLERMAANGIINMSDFKVINEKKTPGFPFKHSTDLYPEWAFASLEHVSRSVVQKVATELLLVSEQSAAAKSGKYKGWTAPLNYQPVHDLLRSLQVSPYQDYGKFSTEDVLYKYWPWLVSLLGLLACAVFFSMYVAKSNRLISQAHQNLQQSNGKLLERIKELNCIYGLTNILSKESSSIDEKLHEFVSLLPPAWNNPESTRARIVYNEKEFMSDNYQSSKVYLSSEIRVKEKVVGVVYIYLLEKPMAGDAFLEEEGVLLDEVCAKISAFLLKNYIEDELNQAHVELEQRVEVRTRELAVAKEAAEKASRAKTDFLSRMSHELRTPMNAILGFSHILLNEITDESHRDSVNEIFNSGSHLLDLINEVLDLARIESGKFDVNVEVIDLESVVNDSRKMTQSLAKQKNISVEVDGDLMKIDNISGDSKRLRQVFINLLSNAIKYNVDGGKISIECGEGKDGYVRVNIKDTGTGLSEAEKGMVFEPFERLDQEYKTEGTGIGLSVTKNLVQLMGGGIGVESQKGLGSTFWVELKKVA